MKSMVIIAFLCLFSFGCTKKSGSTSSSASDPIQTTQNNNPQNLGDLDNGNNDPFIPPVIEPTPAIPDNLDNFCGVLFTDFYDQSPRFLIDNETVPFVLRTDIYEVEQVISRLVYPKDSQRVCIDGLKTAALADPNNDTFLDGYIISVEDEDIAHPNRPEELIYAFEYCGTFRYVTEPDGDQYIEARSNNVFYIVNNINNVAEPDFAQLTMDPAFQIRGCMYSNTAPYNNFLVTFKKFFDAEALNFGDLPVIVPAF